MTHCSYNGCFTDSLLVARAIGRHLGLTFLRTPPNLSSRATLVDMASTLIIIWLVLQIPLAIFVGQFIKAGMLEPATPQGRERRIKFCDPIHLAGV